ncbi:hypothetical protein JCM11491_000695 [Sporobolomyces phaffii]
MLSRCTHCLRPLVRRPVVHLRHSSLLSSAAPRPSRPALSLAPAVRWHSRRPITVLAQPPPQPSEDFEPLDPAEFAPGEHPTLDMALTDSAVKQIERAQALRGGDHALALRLLVESGGCHGYQYKMAVTSTREPDDYLFEPEGTTAKLLVDAASLPLVKGSTIDYATELIGSSFRVVNNPQSKDAGCGCGVSWELKDL